MPAPPQSTGGAKVQSSDFSDSILAEQAAHEVLRWSKDGTGFRWSAGLGWFRWDGKRWRQAPEVEVVEAVRTWGHDVFEEGLRLSRAGEIDAQQLARYNVLLSKSKLQAVVALARGLEGVLTDPAAFDAHPKLLNTQNCVVDLTTGKSLPHNPDLLLTKIAGAGYRQGARHKDWDTALTAIPADVREWVQLRYEQAATGEMRRTTC